jgi:medium-chain acyl-[acyl-carrier-protein] hydrolase
MNNDWFIKLRQNKQPLLRLFCFPYAGGNSSTYAKWIDSLPPHIELICIQPPGRATRIFETPYNDMTTLVSDLYCSMKHLLDKPYVVFGHSLGSKVAYELLCQIQSKRQNMPERLIVSGSAAAHCKKEPKMHWAKSDIGFIKELKRLQGTPEGFFQHEELVTLLLPMLKADFQISDLYRADEIKLQCPINVLSGSTDTIPYSDLIAWQALTTHKITLKSIEGNHFYIDSNPEEVLKYINLLLTQASTLSNEQQQCSLEC